MLGASFILVMALMLFLWVIYTFRRNGGIVDIGWALGFILTVWSFAALGDGEILRRMFIALLVTLWAGRLAYHLTCRYLKSPEDPRYRQIRENWGGDRKNIKFLIMFILQGMLVIVLSTPFMLICLSKHPFSWWEGFGAAVWLTGVAGEGVADWQLKQFKLQNRGKVCRTGFWKYSRHPNYFFEWVVWIGYFLIALPAPGGPLAIISPLLMLYFLLKVSGIPPSEAQSLKTKGEAYREYQRTTSPFLPWIPGKTHF